MVWCVTLAWAPALLARDPFLPLGFDDKPEVKPVTQPTAVVAPVVPIVVPTVTPQKRAITSEDWDAARRQVQITGSASIGDRQVVLMNGKSYRSGEKITLVHMNISFTWRVEISEDRKVNLVPLEAVR